MERGNAWASTMELAAVPSLSFLSIQGGDCCSAQPARNEILQLCASVFMLASVLKVIFPHNLLLVGWFVFMWRSKDFVRCLFSLTGKMSAWLSSSICNDLFSFWLFFRSHLADFE